ncbi:MAG: DUF3857 domain-containing protein [Bacteroidia bacterium]|nr:DUF3857 domain-containing protein [Bacteroidia bacterium]
MKKHLPWYALTLIGLYGNLFSVSAQIPKTDLNLVKQELEMTSYVADPDAGAVIISDYGEAYIEEVAGSLQLRYTKYKRVKIFKESAFDITEVEIPYYDEQSAEKVVGLRGETYFLEGNKVKSYEMTKKDIIEEDLGEGWKNIKFTLPQVKEGSVFEYSYQVISQNFSYIKPWYFQQYYPVAHSEYQTRIPEWFTFLPLFKGGLPLTDRKVSHYTRTLTATNFNRPVYGNPGGGSINQSMIYKGEAAAYIMDNIPGFVREPFMTTPADHLASLEFQLQSVQYPQEPVKPVLGSWGELAKNYMNAPSFGMRLNNGQVRRLTKDLPLEGKTAEEKARLIFDFVRSYMKWNEEFNDLAVNPLNTALDRKEGTSGELNLILLDMLREAGISANPVLVSTRKHGRVQQIFPLARQFNHVIVLVKTEAGEVLLDAIDDFMPFGMLPESDLNDMGFVVDEIQPDWVNIRPQHKQSVTYMINVKMDEEGVISGSFSHNSNGYAAAINRYRLSTLDKNEKEFIQKYITEEWTDIEITETALKAYDDLAKPMEVSFKISGTDYVNVAGDFIYFQPLLSVATTENPFKLKTRTYPVDFATPIHEKYVLNLFIPAGYAVEELPKATRVLLPNNGGTFFYQAKVTENVLQLVSEISINQTLFLPEEYEYIKGFFEMIVAKHGEQIVFKKAE